MTEAYNRLQWQAGLNHSHNKGFSNYDKDRRKSDLGWMFSAWSVGQTFNNLGV